MDRRGSLDAVFSDLLQEAHVWAERNDRNGVMRDKMAHQNGRRYENKETDTAIDACLGQLARAISAHVTDILIERLGLEERVTTASPRDPNRGSSCSDPRSTNGSPHTRCVTGSISTTQSVPQSPLLGHRSALPRRVHEQRMPTVQPFERRCLHAKGDIGLLRYHSENRLNRVEPPPDANETPLENRASRLRRAQAGRRLAGRGI